MEWILFSSCLIVIVQATGGISSKLDFDEASDTDTTVVTNSTQLANDDVEVKHTIVVSTKLKSNNRRGLHSSNDGNSDIMLQGRSQMNKKVDSGEVPVYNGFKAVETTLIRTPDSRHKPKEKTPDILVNRNIGDELDIYPNLATNQWRPSTFYNNINYWNPEEKIVTYNINRKPDRNYRDEQKFQKKLTDEAVKEFYCSKCGEMIRSSRGSQQRNPFETTTKIIKIDGKLAKLN